ncbi:putative Soluble epoxide hydrolase [Blattamonas nauphoetae]|uniref:Soluble epoxide hydrolase n=1 Tax=Blattamonas nauphoetae TaxID=2049346 RepID=A0ABQ9XZK1_9EUKA|nr:putative Soluble epoxide hydrolase [Blattamonas nauphoetae]
MNTETEIIMSEQIVVTEEQIIETPALRYLQKQGLELEYATRQFEQLNQCGYFTTEEKGFRLYYETYGHGPVKVVLIDGWGGHLDDYRHFLLQLIENPELEVLIFDLRGVGFSTSPVKAFTTPMYARDIAGLLKHLGWTRVNIYGASLGGMIALEFYCLFPELVESAVFVSTTAGPYVPSPLVVKSFFSIVAQKDQERVKELGGALMLSDHFLDTYQEKYGMTGREYVGQPIAYTPLTGEMMKFHIYTAEAIACLGHRVKKARLDKSKAISPRVLVIHGTEDRMIPYKNGERLAQMLGCALISFEKAGHLLNLEVEDELTQVYFHHLFP